jgi:hypothetical protein
MSENQLTKEDVTKIYQEFTAIRDWLNPPPPSPDVWPPPGWSVNPANGMLYRVLTEAELRQELFGSPQLDAWKKTARERLAFLEDQLITHFYPKRKEEGTQRKTLHGFITMLKTGLKRTVDETALPDVLDKVPPGTEDKCIKWAPSLRLAEYRELPKKTRDALEAAFVTKPEKPVFEIIPKP